MSKEKFCPEQIKCKEDTEDTWSCTAHLAEGRCMQCPFGSYEDSQDREYPCVDAQIAHNKEKLTIKQRTINALEWMTTQFKWQHDNEKDALCDEGSQGGYSEKLQEAMDLLEELKK